jgi:hypothetical protein
MTTARRVGLPIRLRASAVAIALLCGLGTTLAACTSGGSVLGTRDSACFRVLPIARHDVGQAPKFAGVRHLPSSTLLGELRRHHHTPASAVPESLEANRSAACLVAFRGLFTPADVDQAWAPRPGPYHVAIVIVDESNDRLLATVLLRSTPLNFSHQFAFQQ